jgi:prepilin-type N-terminal cleavage/methylation domain-containing protein
MNSKSSKRRSCAAGPSGFTLLEVLIAMAILAFISLGIYYATTETFRLRDSISVEGDFYNNIRLAMTLLNRDISAMYSPTIMLPKKDTPPPGAPGSPAPASVNGAITANDEAGMNSNVAAELNLSGDYWGPAKDKSGLRPMHFRGQAEWMSFVASSHFRMYKDAPESELVKIHYEFKADENTPSDIKIEGSKILVKTESTDVFDMDETRSKTFAHSYPLLPGITKLKFSYCRLDGATITCRNQWDSAVDDPKDTYPDIIKVELEVKGAHQMYFQGTYSFRPEVPFAGLSSTF